jgi:ketosteroid isomerase-like protein
MSTREEIEVLTARFAQLVTNKDFSPIGSYYEEQARLLLPESAMIEGRSAIQAAQRKLIESGVVFSPKSVQPMNFLCLTVVSDLPTSMTFIGKS